MRLLLLITCIFVSAISLNAQKKLSLHANIGTGFYGFAKKQITKYPEFLYDKTSRFTPKAGVYVGLELSYVIHPKWLLSTGINYQYFQANKVEDFDYYDNATTVFFSKSTYDHKIKALQLPLFCSFLLIDEKHKFSIDLGFISALLMAADVGFYDDGQNEFMVPTGGIRQVFDKKVDFLISTGVTFQPFKSLAFRLSYENGLRENRISRSLIRGGSWLVSGFELQTSGLELGMVYQLSGLGKRGI